ncbi:GNAT family N-acetyltransferase [Phreatobacter sp.]|uniref:GNAT family N-acetyltransferase n=1 Tax=Phreatobacter sp. TaxID=1966341 RepID=UPI003F6E7C77
MTAAAPAWRPMTAGDLAAVSRIAAIVHPLFPEDDAVFRERLALHPAGCLVLEDAAGPAGYAVSHPWRAADFPPLDTLLGAIPDDSSAFYIHDVAILPDARGSGAAGAVARRLVAHATGLGLTALSLVAVNGSAPFWALHGFADATDAALAARLGAYGADARFMTRRAG